MAQEGRMERLRSELLRRARLDRQENNTQGRDEEEGHAQNQATTQPLEVPATHNNAASRSPRRSRLSRLPFGRRTGSPRDEESGLESPKTPVTQSPRAASSFYLTPILPSDQGYPLPPSAESIIFPPAAAVVAESGSTDAERSGDEASQGQAESQTRSSGSRRGQGGKSKRFLLVFPPVKSAVIRTQIVQCIVSGLFLACLLTVYLSLTLTKNVAVGELNIMMIAVILMATVFFVYSIVRLCVLTVRGDRAEVSTLSSTTDRRGYAIPRKPIQVIMPQDEEVSGSESEVAQVKPPAYGLWRESVRVDPNRFYWQRNEAADATPPIPEAGPRPPSYASDDGVSYVVEAVPRSVAPSSVESSPIPPHPSESGRAGQPAAH